MDRYSGLSFRYFLFKEKFNRNLLIIAVIAAISQLLIFKLFYPFADFFSDSYSYVYAASAHLNVNIWPIGYSKFLTIFHWITHSDTALVCFQYFFFVLSALYFFFSIIFFYRPGKFSQLLLFLFLFINPLFLYISNYISSDPFFAALSLLWIGELIWILNRPRKYHLFTQAILLILVFSVRYNALYYPCITLLVFILSSQGLWRKLAGISLGGLLIIAFILFERNAAQKLYGTAQFSPMSGWQIANNALYMYGHIQVDSSQLPKNTKVKELDGISRKFYRRAPADVSNYFSEYVGNFFIRESISPLKRYLYKHYKLKDDHDIVVSWGDASVTFGQYGKWLVAHYPMSFIRYFVLPNAINNFLPPLEKLEVYNQGEDEVFLLEQDWFDYKTPIIKAISKHVQGYILFIFPYIFLFINVLFIGGLVWFILKKGFKHLDRKNRQLIAMSALFFFANFIFSIVTSMIVLRYQIFPIIVLLSSSLLIIECMGKIEGSPENIVLQTGEQKLAWNKVDMTPYQKFEI